MATTKTELPEVDPSPQLTVEELDRQEFMQMLAELGIVRPRPE